MFMHKCIVSIIIVFALSGNLTAQHAIPKTSTGYLSLIQRTNRDTSLINLFHDLGKFYFDKIQMRDARQQIYADSAAWAFTEGIHLADALHAERQRYRLKRLLGSTLFLVENIAAGEKIFMEVINDCKEKGQKDKEALTWKLMADARIRNETSFTGIYTYLSNAMELYRLLGQKESQAGIRLHIADLFHQMGRLEEAENIALQTLREYQAINYRRLYDTYYMLSVINRYQGDLDQALFFAIRCVENVDSIQDKAINPVLFYGELALVYDALGQPEESSQWYRLTLNERKKRPESPIVVLRTAGLLIHQLIKINKGQEALSVISDIQKNYPVHGNLEQAALAQNLGNCYLALGDYYKAENYFLEMNRIFESYSRPDEFISMAYQDAGNFYLAMKKYDKAINFLSRASNPSNAYLISRQRDICLSMYTADSALGNYLAAINDFRKYKMLTDSLFSERKSHQIAELQIKYQTEKKEKDIILLGLENKAQEIKSQKAALVRNIIIVGVVLFAGFLYYRYRVKSASNKKMQAQQQLINQKNVTLTQLLGEKEWLVKEIHHRVKNNFHTVMGLLATQSEFLKNPEAISAIRESRNRIHAMSLIHQKLYQSENLSTIAMPAYIHELVSSLREGFVIPGNVHFSLDIDPVELDLSHAIPLGLILNEAITNAIKYAFPGGRDGLIEISLKQKDANHLLVTVKDNGVGLPAVHDAAQNSMGMKLLKGLSDDMDATLSICGDQGTAIRVEFFNDPEINDES
jgi:two-component sensor histidine kinase